MSVVKEVSKYYNYGFYLFFNWVEPPESFQFFIFPGKNIVASTAYYLLSRLSHPSRTQTCSVRLGRSPDFASTSGLRVKHDTPDQCGHSFFHSFSINPASSKPGTVLRIKDTAVNKTDKAPAFKELVV